MDWTFDAEDRAHMDALGITEPQLQGQIEVFRKSAFFMKLIRPCTVGDGIQQLSEEAGAAYLTAHQRAAERGRFVKFVPASGAATRMFQSLLHYYHNCSSIVPDTVRSQAEQGAPHAQGFLHLVENFARLPFLEDLRQVVHNDGHELDELIRNGDWQQILSYLLTERGLYYGAQPKALLKFHNYPDGSRTAFEEHLVEAAQYVRDIDGVCRLHFTVSQADRKAFQQLLKEVGPRYEDRYHCRFEVSFSVQKRSTDTLAVDLDNRPFRDASGRLVFRPAGHGALLENLNDLQADLIYIKNIDNVVPDRLKPSTVHWKKILGGYLASLQESAHRILRQVTNDPLEMNALEQALDFMENQQFIPIPQGLEGQAKLTQRDFIVNNLNRPMRVCGMVRNVGEPGGGPFWVEGADRSQSGQIVESAQVDFSDPGQLAIWKSATHFNPVDIVCAVRDYRGRPFDLRQFVDPDAVFISQKSKDGRFLKALELPGLWNGAMSKWITVFVEVPEITFNPVKTVNHLLRPQHLPE